MKIFNKFFSICLSLAMMIPSLPILNAKAAPLATEVTEFGTEHIIWGENFDEKNDLSDFTASDGYSLISNNSNVDISRGIKIVSHGNGHAIQLGSTTLSGGPKFSIQKDFEKTWTDMLTESGITPSVGDYIVFQLDSPWAGNAYFFEMAETATWLAEYGGSAQSPVLRTGGARKDVSGVVRGSWNKIRIIYKYAPDAIKYECTMLNDNIWKIANTSTKTYYYDLPHNGPAYVKMTANWSNTLIDDIKISYVKNDFSTKVQSDGVNPYYPLEVDFGRKIVSGEAYLKIGDTVIESIAVSGNCIAFNEDGTSLDFGKTYTLELRNIKDIYGNITENETKSIKVADKTNISLENVVVSELKKISVLLPTVPSDEELADVKICYSDGTPALQITDAYLEDENGNIKLNIPITENLRMATTYTIKMGATELSSFTTTDGVNVTRPVFSPLISGVVTASVNVDNVTNFAGINTAALILMYFEGDKLVKLSTSPVCDITNGNSLNAQIDLSGITLKPSSKVKTFVIDNYDNMYPLTISEILE